MFIQREKLKTNSELRATARQQLNGNWKKLILTYVIFTIICIVPGCIPYLGPIFIFVLGGPFILGLCSYCIKFIRNENPSLENLFDGFNNTFISSLLLRLIIGLFTFLWSLLFIIPGIIAALRYSMAFYIMNDNPQIKAMNALEQSKEMMLGQKGKLFLLYLSFIGWGFLCIITLGIGFLWLCPYIQVSIANFYEDLKQASNCNNEGNITETQ